SIIGLILIYATSAQAGNGGTLNWDALMQQSAGFPPSLFTLAFVFTFIGFAAKSGIVPFHTWLPPAHAKAPSVVSALLSAVLLNVGIYGILRLYAIGYHTPSKSDISMVLFIFGGLTIVVAAFCMLPRTNIKKLIAYSSIEHMGLIIIGIGLGVRVAFFWVLFHLLGHALIKTQLFFSTGILGHQYGDNHIDRFKNAVVLQPLAVWGMIIGGAAIIGTPLFPVFLSKLFILIQIGDRSLWFLALVLVFLLLVAAAFAVFFIRAFTTTENAEAVLPYHAPWTMKAPVVLLLAATLVLGLYLPTALTNMIDEAVACLGF
ncbi:MAG: proton-conducting transporter membrane subunit, partial [Dehalococcoidia bacterium]